MMKVLAWAIASPAGSVSRSVCAAERMTAERIAHLVRDGGGELSERGELLALRQARARRRDRLRLRLHQRGGAPFAALALDQRAEQVAEHGERDAEVQRDDQRACVPAVDGEGDAEQREHRGVEDAADTPAARPHQRSRMPCQC